MKKSGIVYCDFDGTFIKEDIETLWLKFLIRNRKIKWYQYILSCISIPVNLIRKKQFRGGMLKSWPVGMTDGKMAQLLSEFYTDVNSQIHINNKVYNLLLNLISEYDLVLLTGSQENLVKSYLNHVSCKDMFTDIIGSRVKSNGFILVRHPYGKDKCKYINNTKKTIGIANEFADLFYLNICDKVYIVPGDKNLTKLAKEKEWEII